MQGWNGMEQFYKGHRIEISVWLDGDGWIASLYIYYSEGLQNILVTFAVPDTFKTYDEGGSGGIWGITKTPLGDKSV